MIDIPLVLIAILLYGIYENKPKISKTMNDEIKVIDGKMTEKQRNAERCGLLKVKENYPQNTRGKEIILHQIEKSYEE